MKKTYTVIILFVLFASFVSLLFYLTRNVNFAVLNPVGLIALKERNLIVFAVVLMLALALPVLAVTFFIAWRYRADNTKAKYTPDWTGNIFLKLVWWAILCVYVIVFFVIVWNAAHQLDPYKPIASSAKPITIQVVALRWKWLFIYPQQHIATVNFIQVPVSTPVNFELTAGDAPMNSFWIPSLGGQIYAMSTMETKLHLLSDKTGDFAGGAAEINGKGFAGMRFTTRVSSKADFDAWVKEVKKSSKKLDSVAYTTLAKPSEDTPVTYYSSVDSNLYNTIIMQYMRPKMGEGMHR